MTKYHEGRMSLLWVRESYVIGLEDSVGYTACIGATSRTRLIGRYFRGRYAIKIRIPRPTRKGHEDDMA